MAVICQKCGGEYQFLKKKSNGICYRCRQVNRYSNVKNGYRSPSMDPVSDVEQREKSYRMEAYAAQHDAGHLDFVAAQRAATEQRLWELSQPGPPPATLLAELREELSQRADLFAREVLRRIA